MPTLKIATYNIHKGFSHFNRRVVLHELRDRLHDLDADIVFLQEVQGEHSRHPERYHNYPDEPQHEFIAGEVWPHHVYGKNAVYQLGHHGNAVLSRFPIVRAVNTDISAHRFESRGLLHSEIDVRGRYRVHCLCVHFGLFARGRRMQTSALIEYVQRQIPHDEPLIVAGDFNDWSNQMSRTLAGELGVHDVFQMHGGRLARSYPSSLPVFRLDRIYVRGYGVLQCEVHAGAPWERLSDHAALSALVKRT